MSMLRRPGAAGGDTRAPWSPTVAYNETKAPSQVDTLRDEACPVCGETDAAWDGDQCKVCGFVAPPEKMQDPDVDLHRQLDLRQDETPQPEDIEEDTGQPAPEEDELETDNEQPTLTCPNCGYEVEAGQPVTTNTAQPGTGDMGAGPAEGDLCPNCGKATLVSASEEMDEEETPEEDEDDSADSDQDQSFPGQPGGKKAAPQKK